jgi:replication factor C subunit 1
LACPRNTSFCKKRDELFFVDYGIMPLFIHMNYPSSILSGKHPKDDIPKVMSEAADLVAEADMYDTYIRQRGRWDLLTKQAVTVAAVGFKTRGRVGRCEFPETLGKMSTMGKRRRLLSEFVVHTGMRTLSSTNSMRLDYLLPLREHCMRPLSTLRTVEGAKQSVALLKEYGFTRDDAFENLPEFGLGNKKGGDLFSGRGPSLESKVKSAFTRHFNSTGKVSAGQLATMSKQADRDKLLIKQKKKRGGGSSAGGKKKKAKKGGKKQ